MATKWIEASWQTENIAVALVQTQPRALQSPVFLIESKFAGHPLRLQNGRNQRVAPGSIESNGSLGNPLKKPNGF
jgi:hypothetical protein